MYVMSNAEASSDVIAAQRDHESQQRRSGGNRDQPDALARDGEVERAFEHDQDEPDRPQHRHDRRNPVEFDADGVEELPQRYPARDQQHDRRQAVAAAGDAEEVREQQQPGGEEDGGVGHALAGAMLRNLDLSAAAKAAGGRQRAALRYDDRRRRLAAHFHQLAHRAVDPGLRGRERNWRSRRRDCAASMSKLIGSGPMLVRSCASPLYTVGRAASGAPSAVTGISTRSVPTLRSV